MSASIIRLIRLQKGYTQEYMAYCLEISQNAYSRIESGHTNITVQRLLEISKILETDPAVLFESFKKSAEGKCCTLAITLNQSEDDIAK